MITIKGVLTRLTFQNPENHYTVCRIKVDKINDPITVVGHLAGVAEGETLVLKGKWTSHPKYGDQFKAVSYDVSLPATVSGIRKYLGSGMIKGISKFLADKIVDRFQEQTLEIIENDPEKLCKIHGIGKAKKLAIEQAWNSHHSLRRVMQFLQEHGVGASHAATILTAYGNDAFTILTTDPYLIAKEIPKIGFSTADTFARACGVEKEDEKDLKPAWSVSCCFLNRTAMFMGEQQELFSACARTAEVEIRLFEKALAGLEKTEEVVVERGKKDRDKRELEPEEQKQHRKPEIPEDQSYDRVYLSRLYRAESGIASRIKALLSMSVPEYRISREQILEEVLTTLAVKLSGEQLDVVSSILEQKISVITGGPGTGKTTLVRALCAVFRRLHLTAVLSAPTGRAARRLAEVSGQKAFTLHKLLGFDHEGQSFERNFTNPLDLDVFVVDEASMVDTQLMYHLVEAMPPTACLVLVGDTFQLPSVGPGNVLSDIIQSNRVRVFGLTKIFRQAKESPIVMHAHSIRNGKMPDFRKTAPDTFSEFYFIENQQSEKVVKTIIELCSRRIPRAFPHIDEIQVLTPMHKGDAGTINLNQQLQAVLNDSRDGVESHGLTFKTGDKVMHLKNNYEKDVFNGDIGKVHEVLKSEGRVLVDYEGRIVEYDLPELDELTLAYTISVHKSQGSEYTAVIIALTLAHFPMLQRNLLYTAMTRGKRLVIVVGSSRAMEIAFENNKTALRMSGLKEKLMLDG